VFDNYTWEQEGPEIVISKGKLNPARIPLSAIISGIFHPFSQLSVDTTQGP
jgi:hypothetical protein